MARRSTVPRRSQESTSATATVDFLHCHLSTRSRRSHRLAASSSAERSSTNSAPRLLQRRVGRWSARVPHSTAECDGCCSSGRDGRRAEVPSSGAAAAATAGAADDLESGVRSGLGYSVQVGALFVYALSFYLVPLSKDSGVSFVLFAFADGKRSCFSWLGEKWPRKGQAFSPQPSVRSRALVRQL